MVALQRAQKQQSPSLEKELSRSDPELVKLVMQMLEINPYYRPTAQQLLENKVFDSIRMPLIECIETKYKYKVVVDSN